MTAPVEIRLGGPDPFPDETGADCPGRAGVYRCTRNAGHQPPHLAVAGLTGLIPPCVVATWPPYRELPYGKEPW